jgi:hypothetical protein
MRKLRIEKMGRAYRFARDEHVVPQTRKPSAAIATLANATNG